MNSQDTADVDIGQPSTPSENERQPPPWPVPTSQYFPTSTVAGMLLIFLLSTVFTMTSMHRLNHTDLWGHLSFGRLIIDQQMLPATDPFASGEPAARFVNIPWLAQATGFLLERAMGIEGLVLVHASLVTLCCGLLILAVYRQNVSLGWAIVAGAAAFVIGLPSAGVIRPQLCGIALLPLVLMGCSALGSRRHPFAWMPILFVLWANLHGSFAIGLLVMGVCTLAVIWDSIARHRSFKRVLRDPHVNAFGLATIACTIATCFNPLGPRILVVVASFAGHPALQNITEWQPLVLKSLGGLLFFSSMIITAVVLRLSPRRFTSRDVLLLIVFAALALSSMRMLAWWAIIWPWVVVPHAMAAWGKHLAPQRDEISVPNTMRTLFAMAMVFTCALVAPPTYSLVSGQSRGVGRISGAGTPLYVADEITRRQLAGNLFCPMDWGDYLIWTSAGNLKPLVYTHVHLIRNDRWQDYQHISAGGQDWLKLVDARQLDYMLLSRKRNASLARLVQAEDRARILYQDQQCLLVKLLPAGEPSPAVDS